MLSFLDNWVFFGTLFFTKQVSCGRWVVFRTFLAFFSFWPKLTILQRLYIAFASWPTLAVFKMLSFLENWVFFGAVFFYKTSLMWSEKRFSHLFDPKVFFHKTSLMWSENRFSHLFGIFNFWPKQTILLEAIAFASRPTLAIFKMLSFLENWVFFGVFFFSQNKSHVVGESFFAPFCHF